MQRSISKSRLTRAAVLMSVMVFVPSTALTQVADEGAGDVEAAAPSENAVAENVDVTEEGRAHHLEGVAALREGDLELAERAFRRSLAFGFRASTAYNLALALTDLGRGADAVEFFDRVLALDDAQLPRPRADIEQDRSLARSSCAEVQIEVGGTAPVTLTVDGARRAELHEERSAVLFLEAGRRVLVLTEGQRMQQRTLQLTAGETQSVRIVFVPEPSELEAGRPDVAVVPAEDVVEANDGRVRRRRILGWTLGLGAVLAGVAVVLAVVLPSQGEPYSEGPIPNVSALRFSRGSTDGP